MNILDALYLQIATRPRADALRLPEKTLCFGELGVLIEAFCGALRRGGVRPGEIVAVEVDAVVPHLLCSLALARLGAGQFSLAGGASQHNRQAARLLRIEKTVVLADGAVPVCGMPLPLDAVLRQPRTFVEAAGEPAREEALPWLARSSSGTTGSPKVFTLSHGQGGLRRDRYLQAVPLGPDDVFYSMTALHFGAAKQRIYYALSQGSAVAFPPPAPLNQLPALLAQYGVTSAYCVPLHLDLLVELAQGQRQGAASRLLPGVRLLETSSATVTPRLRTLVETLVTPHLVNSYSVSEVGHLAATPPCAGTLEEHSVGRILDGVMVEIVDRQLRPLPPGEPGLIRVQCPGMVESYLDESAGTVPALRGGWFLPGDLGRLSAHNQLIFLGRADDMMIFNGINIYPAEIEQVLLEHPAVKAAVAFPLKSRRHQDVPMAAVIPAGEINEEELAAYCATHLGARRPWGFIFMDEFPRNAMGKVLRRELATLARARAGRLPAPRRGPALSPEPA